MPPPPNPNARRRNARPEWRRLPSAGRRGDPPPFELARPSRAELELWRSLWATPQAAAWEELGWNRSVARYTRLVVQAEKPRASTRLLAEVRQMEDRLGLNPMAIRRLAWTIVDEAPQEENAGGDAIADLDAYRERLG